ncbi:hypothetical protein [Thalassobacillus sp. CUG 92003]|uniref:hypothetical protein n=1 Tax=Thalassobacillus sp. CUG 92003 TaxID=2736641 RepID=UPI0015E7C1D5|nr:hypothetical protein [Thalassobacillus sp. CUG 92003]
MTGMLIVIGFIMDGLIIFALLTLSTRIKKAEELESRQEQVANEIEDLFTSYLTEIKEENEKFRQFQASSSGASPPVQTEAPHSGLEPGNPTDSFRNGEEQGTAYEPPDISYRPPAPDEDEDVYIPSEQSKVAAMNAQGYSVEAIAKELNLGKTETELILKFQKGK